MAEHPLTDVHQHLWPAAFLDGLRARTSPPYLRGWTLFLAGEPPCELDPAAHDVDQVRRRNADLDRVVLSMSSPIGVEYLPQTEARSLLAAWHEGVASLNEPFAAWASVPAEQAEPAELKELLNAGFVGAQLPAGALATPQGWLHLAPVLDLCRDMGRPVFVHPGPVPNRSGAEVAGWWAPVVDYTAQLCAAYWAFYAIGRELAAGLRVCFAAGAGLAPLHHERFSARSPHRFDVDENVFLDTSSYGPRALDALVRVLGIDALVLGSDRPYADITDPGSGAEATRAIRRLNPHRLLTGERS